MRNRVTTERDCTSPPPRLSPGRFLKSERLGCAVRRSRPSRQNMGRIHAQGGNEKNTSAVKCKSAYQAASEVQSVGLQRRPAACRHSPTTCRSIKMAKPGKIARADDECEYAEILQAYTLNLAGSLVGTLAFTALVFFRCRLGRGFCPYLAGLVYFSSQRTRDALILGSALR